MPIDIGPLPETPYFVSKPIDLSDTVHPHILPFRDWICWFCGVYNSSVYQNCSGCNAPYGITRKKRLSIYRDVQSRRLDTIYAVWV